MISASQSPSPQDTAGVAECAWCWAPAETVYVRRDTGEAIGFCSDCDPILAGQLQREPAVCSTHRAGCPGSPRCRDGPEPQYFTEVA